MPPFPPISLVPMLYNQVCNYTSMLYFQQDNCFMPCTGWTHSGDRSGLSQRSLISRILVLFVREHRRCVVNDLEERTTGRQGTSLMCKAAESWGGTGWCLSLWHRDTLKPIFSLIACCIFSGCPTRYAGVWFAEAQSIQLQIKLMGAVLHMLKMLHNATDSWKITLQVCQTRHPSLLDTSELSLSIPPFP